MANHRTILTGSIIFLAFLAVYLTFDTLFINLNNMKRSGSIPLQVSLSPETSQQSILGSAKLRITLTNTSPFEVFLLRWSSPLDLSAPSIGVVTFTSTKTGIKAPCLDMKINHRVPPDGQFSIDDQSIVRIPANGKMDSIIEFKEPKVALLKGEEYRAKAVGSWMGVWVNESGQKIKKLSMDNGMKTGEFESNEVVVKVPGEDESELKA
ncbi:hypothetical protein BKA65DRAFT_515226 [Rhexocercosporidium sp. MPI-PUGE-AT-0058]|nr:hypothetical protein BKA65DRAFT_515226 [Rhexocercosporidium sp. MPI-PUGE-AT-0058]